MPDWPILDYAASIDTLATLQRWSQIVGKVRLALTPWLNHSWHVPLYVNPRGLGTSGIPCDREMLDIDFDLIDHRLVVRSSSGRVGGFALSGLCVADFHQSLFETLATMDVHVTIDPAPQELADTTPLDEDRGHAVYVAAVAHDYWRALLQVDRVLNRFRTGFIGKASPVHLFWGAFDLATTRFSGRRAPLHAGMPGLVRVMRDAYSHEVSSAGFWPGSEAYPHAAFYAYAYPEPPGYREALMPADAFYAADLGEFLLPYDAVRSAADPDARLTAFLQASYGAAAANGGWDRAALETPLGQPGLPRPVTRPRSLDGT